MDEQCGSLAFLNHILAKFLEYKIFFFYISCEQTVKTKNQNSNYKKGIRNSCEKFERNFPRTRKFDVIMIWDHDRYVEASPRSTLQSSNIDLTIFDNLGGKSGIYRFSKDIYRKKQISAFF